MKRFQVVIHMELDEEISPVRRQIEERLERLNDGTGVFVEMISIEKLKTKIRKGDKA